MPIVPGTDSSIWQRGMHPSSEHPHFELLILHPSPRGRGKQAQRLLWLVFCRYGTEVRSMILILSSKTRTYPSRQNSSSSLLSQRQERGGGAESNQAAAATRAQQEPRANGKGSLARVVYHLVRTCNTDRLRAHAGIRHEPKWCLHFLARLVPGTWYLVPVHHNEHSSRLTAA